MKGAAAMSETNDSYQTRQRERDDDYRRAYDEWLASMSPEERRQVEELGLAKAYLPSGSGGAVKDAAESSRARCEDSFEDDEASDEAAEHEENNSAGYLPDEASPLPGYPQAADGEELHDLLRRLVGELTSQSNARLSLECLALVTGLAYCGDSMTEIAKRHGVTRAAVSKRCVELTQSLNLKPSRAMRSLLARQSYRQSRLQHLRHHS